MCRLDPMGECLMGPQLGLARARLRGIQAARYDVVVVLDDDNWLSLDYLRVAWAAMQRDTGIAAVGGRLGTALDGPAPSWFDRYAHCLAVGAQGLSRGPVEKGWLWGAGLVLRRAAVLDLLDRGWRPHLPGNRGTSRGSSDDLELCMALRSAGHSLGYEPALTGEHFIRKERLEWSYVLDLRRADGVASPIIDAYEAHLARRALPPIRSALMGTRGHLARARVKLGPRSAHASEGVDVAWNVSYLRGRLSGLTEERRWYEDALEGLASVFGN